MNKKKDKEESVEELACEVVKAFWANEHNDDEDAFYDKIVHLNNKLASLGYKTENMKKKKFTKFTVEIEMGNDAMNTKGAVARKLKEISHEIAKSFDDNELDGSICDINGSRVGKWEFVLE